MPIARRTDQGFMRTAESVLFGCYNPQLTQEARDSLERLQTGRSINQSKIGIARRRRDGADRRLSSLEKVGGPPRPAGSKLSVGQGRGDSCACLTYHLTVCRASNSSIQEVPSTMGTELISAGWDQVLRDVFRLDRSSVRIVCPFIQCGALVRILGEERSTEIKVITRFKLRDFSERVNDLDAIEALLGMGAQVRGVRNLHAKLYLAGSSRAIVTSANLTDAALRENHELGFVTDDELIVGRCSDYFDQLWANAGENVTAEQLKGWRSKVMAHQAETGGANATPLGDEGTRVDMRATPVPVPAWTGESKQAFVKFFGQGHNRADRQMLVLDEIKRSGSHWACTYPKGRRPRSVRDGASMFMGRLVKGPVDILIFGRAVGLSHVEGRDDATPAELRLRAWKEKWPHYVRVHNAEFIGGVLVLLC